MSTLTTFTPIPDGTGATPSVFNSRYSVLHQNADTLNADKLETVSIGDIETGAVGNDALATNAVSTAKVLDQAITGNKIATASKITCYSVTPTAGYRSGVKLTNSGSGNYVTLIADSNGALGVYQYISPNLTGVTLITAYRRLKILGDYPTSSTSAAFAGEFSASSQYFYYAVSNNSWKRVALTGW